MTNMDLTRRTFVVTTAAAGGGLMLGVFTAPANADAVNAQPWLPPSGKPGIEINQWLSIDPDGSVTAQVVAVEMGQDALTTGAMIIAEELSVDWSMIRAQFVSATRHIAEEYLYGTKSKVLIITASNHVTTMRVLYQQGAASARERLKEAAAQSWNIARSRISAQQGVLSSGSRSGTYAEFATAAASVTLTEEPAIKTPDQFTVIGTSVARLDTPLKVNGSAQYGIDTRIPGMVYAAVQSSPVPGGTLMSYDFDAIKDRPGIIQAVELGPKNPEYNMDHPWSSQYSPSSGRGGNDVTSGVAVLADSWYRAKTALELMPIEWDDGPGAGLDNEAMYAQRFSLIDQPGDVAGESGDAPGVIAASSRVITADYRRTYHAHSPMEPMNATASVTPSRVDVWVGTQSPVIDVEAAADQAGVDVASTFVHSVFLGGGFGRRGVTGASTTRQAVEISKQTGLVVKMVWTREEDTMQNFMRSMGAARFTAALGATGLPEAIFTQVAGERYYARRGVRMGTYQIPNQRREAHIVESHIPTTYLRAVGTGLYTFMSEQFIDEMALAGGWDPLEYRLALTEGLDSEQLVLNTLKERSGFTTDLPRGEGMGVAISYMGSATSVGHVATVSVSRRGQLRVEKFVAVVSTGHLVNPSSARDQVESAGIYELSHVLRGAIDIRNGRVVTNNFDTYHLMRMADMPEIEVHFALTGGERWGGMGEPPLPAIGPAVANAVFFATGKRVRSTPLSNHDLSWS